MIATRTFVFLHLHKSGGTFINKALLEFFPEAVCLGYHLPVSELPERYQKFELLGVVRNPWSYYVSWWDFQHTLRQPTFVWRVFSADGKLSFAQTIRRMIHCGDDSSLVDRLIAASPDEFTSSGVNLTKRCLEPLRNYPGGWYSFLFERMYGHRQVHFLRQESLRGSFLEFLKARHLLTDDLERYVASGPPCNVTAHAPLDSYYDRALALEVHAQERLIVERFGYAFATVPGNEGALSG
jgi:hypothetical protein